MKNKLIIAAIILIVTAFFTPIYALNDTPDPEPEPEPEASTPDPTPSEPDSSDGSTNCEHQPSGECAGAVWKNPNPVTDQFYGGKL